MHYLIRDRRLFICTLGILAVTFYPAAAPFVSTIVAAYLANRAFSDKKILDAKVKVVDIIDKDLK